VGCWARVEKLHVHLIDVLTPNPTLHPALPLASHLLMVPC
jgi:hypothetical protein